MGDEDKAPTTTRKWADKKTNFTAAEMRAKASVEVMRNHRSSSLSVNPLTPVSAGNSNETVGTPLTASTPELPTPAHREQLIVEPIDYDKLVKEKKKLIEKDPIKDLLVFPEDDIVIEIVPHEYRTVRSSLPKQASDPQLPLYMQDLFDFYTADYFVVKRKYENLAHFPKSLTRSLEEATTKEEKRKLSAATANLKQKYEIDMSSKELADDPEKNPSGDKSRDIRTMFADNAQRNELDRTEADPLVLKFLTPEGKVEGEVDPQIHGQEMFTLFRDLENIEQAEDFDERPLGEPFKEEFGRRIMVECVNLTIGEPGNAIEPFFGILALYDLNAKKKISENFHFDTNTDDIMELISKHTQTKEFASMSRQALFQVNYPNPDIHLVIRIEKVLEGDPTVAYERYAAGKPKVGKETVSEFCERLGKYRQPFAWGAIPVFNNDKELDVGQETLDDCVIKPLFRLEEKLTDEDLIANIISLNSQKGTKKLKTTTGEFRFKISELDYGAQPLNCFTPFLVPVKPFSNDAEIKIIREVEEFPQEPIIQPHIDFVNALYVYPLSLNLTKYQGQSSARNIVVKVYFVPNSDTEKIGGNAMKAIYGKSSSKVFTTEAVAAVNFHNKTPTFYEEVKIAIPLNLTKTHQIVFAFYHVGCKPKKQQEETLLGFSWLPVIENGRIIVDEIRNLPVAAEYEKNYDVLPALKYHDGKKQMFTVRTKLVSSVYTHDPHLTAFFSVLQDSVRLSANENELANTIFALLSANSAALVQYSPILFDELFGLLSRTFSTDVIHQHTFRVIVHLVTTVHSEKKPDSKRDPSLVSYVKYRYMNKSSPTKNVFEEIFRQWLYFLEQQNTESVQKDIERFAWFFFDISMKSALQYLHTNHQWKSGMIPEKSWFSGEFLKSIKKLFPILTEDVLKHSKTSLIIGKELNEAMAYFLTDMFVCFERKTIFKLIQLHINQVSNNESEVLLGFKFDFLRIVCGYEHYVALNLPTMDYAEKPFEKLSSMQAEFWKRHFLAGLLINEVNNMLEHVSRLTRLKAITTLKDILGKHDADPRLDNKDKRSRVASIYLPILPMLINHHQLFLEDKSDEHSLTSTERRSLLMCFLFVIKNIDTRWLFEWVRKETPETFSILLDIMAACIDTFQYLGRDKIFERHSKATQQKGLNLAQDMKRQFENFYASSMSHNSRLAASRASGGSVKSGTLGKSAKSSGSISSRGSGGSISRRSQNSASFKGTYTKQRTINSSLEVDDEVRLEGSLATDVSIVVLDIFDAILAHQNPKSHDTQQASKMFDLLIKFFEKQQSDKVLLRLIMTMKAFILKFPQAIFREGTTNPYCAELCRVILRQCSSVISSVRQYSAALIYLLMKANYEATNMTNFMKVRVQITVALSKLSLKEDEYLRRALATVIEYSLEDPQLPDANFPTQVKDAIDKLFMILRDTVKMNEHKGDTDMLVDMHYRIAKGYMNAPDLRLASLDAVTRLHFQEENWAEAAFCYLHSAALVSQCLVTMKERHKRTDIDLTGLPAGAAAFGFITANLLEEADSSTEGEGIGESPAFSERGLTDFLEKSIHYLAKANLYEVIKDVYKLIIPIIEKNKDWERLATAHYSIHKHLSDLVKANTTGKRFLGTFFRISFFGDRFGQLKDQEFIYREKKITRLADVSTRLEAYYSEKFKPENFALITDSNTVDPSKLDPNKAYLQITYVEPYFDEKELTTRTSIFDRFYGINRFFYETPYTKEGKAHGGVESQYKRKTILNTEMLFPYVKRRLKVISRQEVDMIPIEVSIESIAKRCEALQAAIQLKDAKNLQVVLQGSVRVQVMSGPMEIANTFMTPDKVSQYSPDHIQQLRSNFVHFLRLCYEALTLNRSLVKHDQQAYQEDLAEGYTSLKTSLMPFLNVSNAEVTRTSSSGSSVNVLALIGGVDSSGFLS